MATAKRSAVTRVDVARLAGVAEGTVSRVLRGHANVSPDLSEKVMKAVKELGYHPNLVASGLRSNSTMQLGMIIPFLNNPFYAAVAEGVEEEAADQGYSLVITVSGKDKSRPVKTLLGRRVDAVVDCSGDVCYEACRPLLDMGVLWVGCGFRNNFPVDIPFIISDIASGAEIAAKHLLELGHGKIALLPGRSNSERLEGWLKVLGSHGLDPITVAYGKYTYESGYTAADTIIRSGATGVLVGNDIMALAVINRAAKAGMVIPRDLSVVGYDDIWLADSSNPPLTTINTDPKGMGIKAARMAIDKLSGKDVDTACSEVRLVVRESTGNPLQ